MGSDPTEDRQPGDDRAGGQPFGASRPGAGGGETPAWGPPAAPGSVVAPYRPARTLAVVVMGLLGATAALDVIAVFSDLAEIGLLQRIEEGTFTFAEVEANDARQGFIGLLQLLLLLVTGVLFLVWLHGSTANLPALGAHGLRFTPGWAVGWWFVPFMNFFRPFQVVREVWTASDPARVASSPEDRAQASAPLVGGWWALYLTAQLVGVVYNFQPADTIDQVQIASRTVLVADALDLAAAVLALLVVREISNRQRAKAAAQPH